MPMLKCQDRGMEQMNESTCKCPPHYHEINGKWCMDDLRRAFVNGAKAWERRRASATMWRSDVDIVEAEAERMYPGGVPLGATTKDETMNESSKRYRALKWWFGDRFEAVYYRDEKRYRLEMDIAEVVFVVSLIWVLLILIWVLLT